MKNEILRDLMWQSTTSNEQLGQTRDESDQEGA